MALTIDEGFEGTNGATADATNTIFDAFAGSAVGKFSTTFKKSGTSALYLETVGGTAQFGLTRTNVTTKYWTFYLRPTQAPSGNSVLFFVGASLTPTDRSFQLTLNADLTMKVQEGSAGIITGAPTASTLPLNQWSRLDVQLVSGALKFSLYPGDALCDSAVNTAAAGNVVSATVNTAITSLYLGVGNSTTNKLYFDSFREDDAALPGPITPGTPVPTPGDDTTEKKVYYYDGTAWIGLV